LDFLISDRDPQFTTKAFENIFKLLGIEHAKTMAFHPQSDRTTEHFNQEIEAYLSIYCFNNPTNWLATLLTLEFTHNN
jgi:hypothetical protein